MHKVTASWKYARVRGAWAPLAPPAEKKISTLAGSIFFSQPLHISSNSRGQTCMFKYLFSVRVAGGRLAAGICPGRPFHIGLDVYDCFRIKEYVVRLFWLQVSYIVSIELE